MWSLLAPYVSWVRMGWMWDMLVWGADHTDHLWHHLSASLVVIMWNVVGHHLFMNIIPNNFMDETRRKVRWGRDMRDWSHQSFTTTSINIFDNNIAKSGGPTSISQRNPQQFHDRNWTESLVWSGHESKLGNSTLSMSKPFGYLTPTWWTPSVVVPKAVHLVG